MAETETKESGAALVPGAHRTIRRIDADEGPYAGTLVTRGAAMAVLVDSASISGWAGWDHAGDDHVAGPLDIVRRADGHDALLPWCTERVATFVGRRAAAGVALGSGEMTTLVASILRGLGELGRTDEHEHTGGWWLTDDGRPTFVIGAGETARTAAAGLVARIREDCVDRALGRLLVTIEEGLSAATGRPGMPMRQLEGWEAELFDTAAPKPLRRDVHAPELARSADAAIRAAVVRPDARSRVRTRATRPMADSRVRAVTSRVVAPLLRRLDLWRGAMLFVVARRHRRDADRARAARVDSSVEAPTAGVRTPVRRGRRAIVAAAAAVAVLAGGLLWPGGATGEPGDGGAAAVPTSAQDAEQIDSASADPSPAATPTAPEPKPDESPKGSPPERADPEDPVEAAHHLIDAIRTCAANDDAVCAEAVAQGSIGVADALAGGEGVLQLEPVDEYGDVAVIRASASGGEEDGAESAAGERMVVLVRVAEKWLVRDVYDVADQPG